MYKRIIITLILILSCIFLLSFFGSKYIISEIKSEIKKNNNKIQISDSLGYATIENLSLYFSANKIGLKLHNAKLYAKSEVYSFNNPIILSINFWNLNPTIQYTGTGEYKKSNISYNFDLNTILNINTRIDFLTLRRAIEYPISNISNIDYIDFDIKSFKFSQDKNLIAESSDTSYTIVPTFDSVYKSTKDILNNIPKKYSVSGIINSKFYSTIETPNLLKIFLLTNYDFSGSFFLDYENPKLILDSDNFIPNSKINFICKDCELKAASADIKYKQNFLNSEKKILNFEFQINPKDNFQDEISKLSFLNSSELDKVNSIIKEDIPYLLKNKLPKFKAGATYKVKHNGEYKLTESHISGKIGDILITSSSGKGIGITGDISIDNIFSHQINAEIVLYNADETIRFWNDYYLNNISTKSADSSDYIKFNGNLLSHFLKEVSTYPTSDSKNLMFSVHYKNLGTEIKVSDLGMDQLKEKYYNIMTRLLLKEIKNRNNYNDFIDKVAPEAKPYIEQIVNMEESEQKISDELWQKLTQ
jgi:hypothetical protein